MAFIKKNWFNRPNVNTPIDANGLNDLEDRIANATKSKITTFQVLIDGDDGTTVIGGVTYYVKSKVVTFEETYAVTPNILLTPNSGAINFFGYTGLGRGQVTIHVGRIVTNATNMSIVLISND